MKFISLFAGIGGLDLGLERAGMECVAQVEIDDYATRVLTKHWPNVPKFRDVRSVGAHNLPAADAMCAGFPCQDISASGPRLGLAGVRSGLWRECARLVGEIRPRYVIVENVADLIYRGVETVLGDLAALGYDAEWEVIPACAFGAPHTRERLFIVAYSEPREWGPFSAARRHMDNAHNSLYTGRQKGASGFALGTHQVGRGAWASEPAVGRVANGLPHRLERISGLGNAVVPEVAEFVGRAVMAHAAAPLGPLFEEAV